MWVAQTIKEACRQAKPQFTEVDLITPTLKGAIVLGRPFFFECGFKVKRALSVTES